MGGEMPTVIYGNTPPEPHNQPSLLWVYRSNRPGRGRPRLPPRVFFCLSVSRFLQKSTGHLCLSGPRSVQMWALQSNDPINPRVKRSLQTAVRAWVSLTTTQRPASTTALFLHLHPNTLALLYSTALHCRASSLHKKHPSWSGHDFPAYSSKNIQNERLTWKPINSQYNGLTQSPDHFTASLIDPQQ